MSIEDDTVVGTAMASRRLCIVTHTFLPHVGGIERVVYEQGRRLMQLGFNVTILTSRMQTPMSYTHGGLHVECYDSINLGFSLGIPYSIPQTVSFRTFLKHVQHSDIVHVHGHPYLSSLVAGKLAKHYQKPLVVTQHNTFIEYESFWDNLESLNDLIVGRRVLSYADRIITVSEATRRYVLSLGAYQNKIRVLRNGVDIARFKPSSVSRGVIRKRLDIPDYAFLALTVRRLVYKNGIDTLIESARIALKQCPNLIFLVVGTGPDRDAVETTIHQHGIGDRFKLVGFVSDADLPSYYNAANVFVLPSKSGEGLPLVALEAMSTGLPIIATQVGGIREVMIEGYGELVPPDDPEAMARAIVRSEKNDSASIRIALRKMAERTFSWNENVKKLTEIYEELI